MATTLVAPAVAIAALLHLVLIACAAGAATPEQTRHGRPRRCSFDFRGLRAEIRASDAVVLFAPIEASGDSALGIDPESKMWRRMYVRGVIRATLGHSQSLQVGDTVEVVAPLTRVVDEYGGIGNEMTDFWSGMPLHFEGIVLLHRVGGRWEATRALLPDTSFVAAYVRTASLETTASARELMSLFVVEYFGADGHVGRMRVLWDDIRRLESVDPRVTRIVDAELARVPAERACGGRLFDLDVLAELAPRFPESHRKACVRSFLYGIDDAERTLRELERVPPEPAGELTENQHRRLSAVASRAILPEALRLLLPDRFASTSSLSEVVEAARRWLEP